ncbi:hypothetical protein CDAR_549551 [Caerostris darwini]|uniref:Uncharacterized protein n=1 Tax=Caerostris darwini TaxID=1538125 RepID=A0AAV4V7P6_9ARAC|nr:hypothetical protein CDAR_549551 [Caerostris darwini]
MDHYWRRGNFCSGEWRQDKFNTNCDCADCIETSRISGQHKNSDISSPTFFQTSSERNPILYYMLVKKSKTLAATFLHQLQSARVKKSRLLMKWRHDTFNANCNCTDCTETSRMSGQHKNGDISSSTLIQTSPESNPILCYILVKNRKLFAATFLHQLYSCEEVSTFLSSRFSLSFRFHRKVRGKVKYMETMLQIKAFS